MAKSLFAAFALFLVFLSISLPVYSDDDFDEDIWDDPNPPKKEDLANLLTLKDADLDATIQSTPNLFVLFYAPWCPHCKAMMSDWARTATAAKNEGIDLKVARVDCVENTEADAKYADGYPTIKLFMNGEATSEYMGDRSTKAMLRWAQDRLAGLPEEDNGGELSESDFDDSDVFELDASSFTEFIEENPNGVLVNFCRPGAPGCIQAYYEFSLLEADLRRHEIRQALAKVDAFTEQTLAQKYNIQQYPTVLLFRDGDASDPTPYTGEMTSEKLHKFLQRKLRPVSLRIDTTKELEQLLALPGPKALLYSSEDSAKVAEWHSASKKDEVDHIQFAQTHSAEVFQAAAKSSAKDTFAIIPEFEGVKTAAATTASEMAAFAKANDGVLFAPLGEEIWTEAGSTNTPIIVFFVKRDDAAGRKLAYELAKVAKDGKNLIAFAVAEEFMEGISQNWGLSGNFFPSMSRVTFNEGMMNSVVYDEESGPLTLASGKDFIARAVAGTYPSYKLSEPIPASNSQPLKKIVYKTFDAIVNDPTKDVIVEFYAPWCGHCQQLYPTLVKLAEQQKDNATLVIGQYDLTANASPDLPAGLEVQGFPTIYLFPEKNKKAIASYDGDRTLEDLLRFIHGEPTVSPQEAYMTGDDIVDDEELEGDAPISDDDFDDSEEITEEELLEALANGDFGEDEEYLDEDLTEELLGGDGEEDMDEDEEEDEEEDMEDDEDFDEDFDEDDLSDDELDELIDEEGEDDEEGDDEEEPELLPPPAFASLLDKRVKPKSAGNKEEL